MVIVQCNENTVTVLRRKTLKVPFIAKEIEDSEEMLVWIVKFLPLLTRTLGLS